MQPADFDRVTKSFAPSTDKFVVIGIYARKENVLSLFLNILNFSFSGQFNDLGLAEGKIEEDLNPITAIRLVIKSSSKNWVIISEVREFVIFFYYAVSADWFITKETGQL